MPTYSEVVRDHTTSDATQSQTNGLIKGVETHGVKKNSVERIQNIPVVQEFLERLFAIIMANSLLAMIYTKFEKLAVTVYHKAEPIVQQPLTLADSYANKGLDIVENKYPGVFSAKSEDVIKTAKKPAQDALEVFQVRLQSAQNSLVAMQEQVSGQVSGVVAKVPKNQAEAQKAISELQSQLAELQKSTSAQVKDLPKNAQTVAGPLIEHLQTGINDIQAELKKSDVSVQDKAKNVYAYSQDNLGPVIAQTIENLKSLVVAKKEEVEKKASE